jgi:hypothetical protein
MLARDADFTIDTSSIFDVNLIRQTQSQSHIPTANMVVYYQLPMLGKVGSHYVRQHPGQQDLSARKRGIEGGGRARWAGVVAYNSMEEWEYGLTSRAQQLAMGVLGTMFGGIALLSGGSSKAVQQSPPIKASSRGEEDFIQYVSITPAINYGAIQSAAWKTGQGANTHAKEIPQGRRGREELDTIVLFR